VIVNYDTEAELGLHSALVSMVWVWFGVDEVHSDRFFSLFRFLQDFSTGKSFGLLISRQWE